MEEVERDPEVEHRDAEQREEAGAEHLARDLRRRRHVAQVVERADDEHHARREHHTERLRVVAEHLVELPHPRRDRDRGEEPDEHRRAAERRHRHLVHAPLVGRTTTAPKCRASTMTTGVSSRVVPAATARTTA